MARRIAELSLIKSALCHEERLVSTTARLNFASIPTSLTDSPADLVLTSAENRNFIKFRAWLVYQQQLLRAMPSVNDRDADHRRCILLEKVTTHLDRLSTMEKDMWEGEKLVNGLYGFPDETETQGPRVYQTGMFISIAYSAISLKHRSRAPLCITQDPAAIHPHGSPRHQCSAHRLRDGQIDFEPGSSNYARPPSRRVHRLQ